jgi:hypothetical protein
MHGLGMAPDDAFEPFLRIGRHQISLRGILALLMIGLLVVLAVRLLG